MSSWLKRGLLLISVLVLVASLAGCQQVSDARAEFCTELRAVGTRAAELKSAKIDEPLTKYQATIDDLAAKRRNIQRLARLTSIEAVDKLDAALDKVAAAYAEFKGGVISPTADKLTAAADELQQVYANINTAVCAAK
jgi:hypothetical protein